MRKQLIKTLLLTLMLTLAASSPVLAKKPKVNRHAHAKTAGPRWEYKVTRLISVEELNRLGAEGWELVAIQSPDVDNIALYFKRRKG